MSGLRAFRSPRTIGEFLDMMDAADALRAAGRSTDEIDAALAAVRGSFDPDGVEISRMLRGMQAEPMRATPTIPLSALDVPPIPGRLDDMDGPTLAAINKANNSFQGLQSGRTLNLRNQNTPLNQIRREDILTAAEEGIRGQQQAAASEGLGRAAATLGAGGLAAMIAESAGRMTPSPAGMGDMESIAEAPELEPLPAPRVAAMPPARDFELPDVPIDLPEAMDPPDMYADATPVVVPDLAPLDVLEDDPMATADLVEESRPIPVSTPRLTPEEIDALRSQVVAIRDAQTGEAMDSFYPPESEEYKAEQRMKKMYPQLRRR